MGLFDPLTFACLLLSALCILQLEGIGCAKKVKMSQMGNKSFGPAK